MSEPQTFSRDALHAWLLEALMLGPGELDDDTPLRSSALLGSMDLLDLVGWIEASAGIKVPAMDWADHNFEDIRSLVRYVEGRLA